MRPLCEKNHLYARQSRLTRPLCMFWITQGGTTQSLQGDLHLPRLDSLRLLCLAWLGAQTFEKREPQLLYFHILQKSRPIFGTASKSTYFIGLLLRYHYLFC